MSARIAIGFIVFESTNKRRTRSPFEFAIIWRDGSVPKTTDESLFLGVGAVCEVLFLVNDIEPGKKKVQRAYCVVNTLTRNGQQGRLEWLDEAQPPPGYGTVVGIYTSSTMDLGLDIPNATPRWLPPSRTTKEAHGRLIVQSAESATLKKVSSLKWVIDTMITTDFTAWSFMPWLPRVYEIGHRELNPRLDYMEDFASEIKRDFYQNGQGVVGVYVANTVGPSSEGTERAGTVCVCYVDRRVDGIQMDQVCLSRVPHPPIGC